MTSLDRRRAWLVKLAAEPREDRQPFIDSGEFFPRKFAKHPTDPPFIDGSQLVDQRERFLRETALAGRESWIEQSFSRSPCDRNYAQQRKALVTDDVRVAHGSAGSDAVLFATYRGV